MRLRSRYYIFVITLILLYIFIKHVYFTNVKDEENPLRNNQFLPPVKPNAPWYSVQKNVTLLLRYTPGLSTDLNETIASFANVYPIMSIIVVSDSAIAQAVLPKTPAQIKIVLLKLNLLDLVVDRNPLNYVKTKYLLIVPLGVIVIPPQDILKMIEVIAWGRYSFLALPVNNEEKQLQCLRLHLNLRQWTVEYSEDKDSINCDAAAGDHGILAETNSLRKLGEPFMLPFPEALYIQGRSLGMRVNVQNSIILKRNVIDDSSNAKHNYQELRILMNQHLGIKKVIRETGVIEWYGCTRYTKRCFPTIHDSTPNYLHEGRWTPPCCLRVLRETAQHVFKTLQQWNVTYWLEGGSLLGAMRNKDIIPWDYDVDIGIYQGDIDKCPWLRKVHGQKLKGVKEPSPVVDKAGFVWSAAQPDEGDFYRVKASLVNSLHVDIFPFYSRKGIMTKDTWLGSHPQDKEFPEHYLKPLTTIEFAGVEASAPNNIREFLELKFGKGCVENPQYPNPKVLSFPKEKEPEPQNDNDNYELN